MPRRHIGDGPSPCLLGSILLILAERAGRAASDGAADGKGAGATAGDLGHLMNLSPAQVRTCTADLARARCLRVGRIPIARHNESGRYAQAFTLPAPSEERGPSRRSRLRPVALIVEPAPAVADRVGRVLRELSMLPVAVATSQNALALLDHLGFELVLVDASPAEESDAPAALAELQEAARQAGCGPVMVMTGGENLLAAKLGKRVLLASPTDPQALRIALARALDISDVGEALPSEVALGRM